MEEWRHSFQSVVRQLAQAKVESPAREAALLLELASGRSLSDWIVHGGKWQGRMVDVFSSYADRRARREPYHYIAGTREFLGMPLHVNSRVLIPRPETELLVQAVLDRVPAEPLTVVDVGTGSGAIALALRQWGPTDWTVIGTEKDQEALMVAKANAQAINVQVMWREGDLLKAVPESIDVVVANLPYVDGSEQDHLAPELIYEPAQALYADDGGLAVIKELIVQAAQRFGEKDRDRGASQIFLEHGIGQSSRVVDQLVRNGFEHIECLEDYAGIVRFVAAQWTRRHQKVGD